MKLDAHQHFWRYSAVEYPWIPPGSALQRDWLPQDLAALQTPLGFNGSIAVQARQTLEETRWLISLADQHPRIKAVVGWVDLRAPELPAQLKEFAGHPKFVGVRHVVQDEPDDRFMLGAEFLRGLGQLNSFRLTYDLLIFPKQLSAACEVVARFPEQQFVLDHIAKPAIKERRLEPWAKDIRELARHPNVFCKLSGLVTEADHQHWREDDLVPYLDVVAEAFGPARLMIGSDWPVCLLAASYERTMNVVMTWARKFSSGDQAAIFGDNCARFYLSAHRLHPLSSQEKN
jgi:L-fuconolactonase